MSANLQCSICINVLDVKTDQVHTTYCGHIFHRECLEMALKTSSICPKCRKHGTKHFQLFFEMMDDDEEAGGAIGLNKDTEFLSKQIRLLEKKFDNLSATLASQSSSSSSSSTSALAAKKYSTNIEPVRRDYRAYGDYFTERDNRVIQKLREENSSLKEIVEMERLVGMNTDKEIEKLKAEIRERNDLINMLQSQNDDLREEKMMMNAVNGYSSKKSVEGDLVLL